MQEHCSPDANRNRELDRALEILERTCECGNDKMTAPDGSLADTCRECQDLDRRGHPYRVAKPAKEPSPPGSRARHPTTQPSRRSPGEVHGIDMQSSQVHMARSTATNGGHDIMPAPQKLPPDLSPPPGVPSIQT